MYGMSAATNPARPTPVHRRRHRGRNRRRQWLRPVRIGTRIPGCRSAPSVRGSLPRRYPAHCCLEHAGAFRASDASARRVGASAAGHSPPPGWQLRLSTLRRTAGCRPSVTPRTPRPQSADVTPAEHARMGTAVPLCSSATRLGHRSSTTLSDFAGIVRKSTVDTCRGRWEVCRR